MQMTLSHELESFFFFLFFLGWHQSHTADAAFYTALISHYGLTIAIIGWNNKTKSADGKDAKKLRNYLC